MVRTPELPEAIGRVGSRMGRRECSHLGVLPTGGLSAEHARALFDDALVGHYDGAVLSTTKDRASLRASWLAGPTRATSYPQGPRLSKVDLAAPTPGVSIFVSCEDGDLLSLVPVACALGLDMGHAARSSSVSPRLVPFAAMLSRSLALAATVHINSSPLMSYFTHPSGCWNVR